MTPAHRHEAEAAAPLLLRRPRAATSATYSLPALIRANGIRPRPFRRIAPTEAIRANLAQPFFAIVRAWQAERDALLAAYSAALPDRGDMPAANATATVQRQIDASAAKVAAAVAQFARRYSPALARIDHWHRAQWVQRIKAATRLNVAMFTPPGSPAVTANAQAWGEQLADSLHQDARQSVAGALTGGLATRAPAAIVAVRINAALAKAKRRAARIGVDQAERTVAAMTRKRGQSAGLDRWRWRHTPQPRPRPEHVALDGRVYTAATTPNIAPGDLPFCKCWREWLFD